MTLIALALIVVAAFAAGLAFALGTKPSGPEVNVDVASPPITAPLPAGFLGFSVEYDSVLPYTGTDPAAVNPPLLQLVRNLNPGQSPVIRIGGDTTDKTWWPAPGLSRPHGIGYTLTRRWVQIVGAMARELNARLILGINFKPDSRAVAASESDALVNGIGRRYIGSLELGNEPEVYGAIGWYFDPRGTRVYARPRNYALEQFLPDYARILPALPSTVPAAGPATGGPAFIAATGRFLAAEPRIGLGTFHRYPLRSCRVAPRSPELGTIPHLLSPTAATGLAQSIVGPVAAARAHGVPVRVDEINSVTCGGQPGVSDTFASALWALDALFAMDRVGVAGVNFHTFAGAVYAPFSFTESSHRRQAHMKPLYYGLLLFARAAPPGSRLLSVSHGRARSLRTWATRGPDGTVRVLLVNDSRRQTLTAAIRAPGSAQSGSLQRLTAPSLTARRGVRLAGQSFGAQTSTGALRGSSATSTMTATDRRFAVELPPASAALLTLKQ